MPISGFTMAMSLSAAVPGPFSCVAEALSQRRSGFGELHRLFRFPRLHLGARLTPR